MKMARLAIAVLFLAAFVVFLPLGCSSDDDNGGDGGGNGGSITAINYVPLVVGAHWEYQDSLTDGTYDTSTTDITGTTEMMGYESYVFVDADGESDTYYIQNRSDGIYQIVLPSAGKLLRAMNTIQYEDTMVMRFMPATFNIGDSWTVYENDTTYDETVYRYYLSTEFVQQAQGFETVSVPAGTFSNCLKLFSTLNVDMTVVMLSDTTDTIYSYDSESHGTTWLASGVGMVKYMSEESESLSVSVLISYSGVSK